MKRGSNVNYMPPGCSIHLEKQAMEAVLKNIKAAYANLRTYIPETIKTFAQDTGKELSLKNYLEVDLLPIIQAGGKR